MEFYLMKIVVNYVNFSIRQDISNTSIFKEHLKQFLNRHHRKTSNGAREREKSEIEG